MKKTKIIALSIALISSLVLVVGCGDKDDNSTTNTNNSSALNDEENSENTEIEAEAETEQERESEAETEEEIEEETPLVASTDLSSDWSSYEIELNGVLYSLPVRYSELEANGWSAEKSEDMTSILEANQYYVTFTTMHNGEDEISIKFANLESEDLPISDCYVNGVQFSTLHSGETALILPGNVTLGTSLETVESLYGEPSDKTESDYSIELTYELEIYDGVIITFDPTTKKVTKMSITNI